MKLIDYVCKCGNIVEDWEEPNVNWDVIKAVNDETDSYNEEMKKAGSSRRMTYSYSIWGMRSLNICCGTRIMEPRPWPNNKAPTVGVK